MKIIQAHHLALSAKILLALPICPLPMERLARLVTISLG
jgi:hypothetical protein